MNKSRAIFNSAIVLYFIIALEILIMISPFAGFFYSVFNPFLLEIAKYPSMRWLSAFYLPHMVIPPDDFLKAIRVLGSILFVGGMVVFLICAVQVYANKFRKKGTVLKGLYSTIRHPQYVALASAGIGLSILWPHFLVLALWLIMILLYYFLSKDEEKKMLKDYPETYRAYMETTGMFLPKRVEKYITLPGIAGRIALFVVIAACVIGGAFLLRQYTLKHLPLWSTSNIAVLAVIPEDLQKIEHRMPEILAMYRVKADLDPNGHYLVYFLPANYIMQGLIADTGGQWKLYKQHHAVSMITDWIFHPFSHLAEGHHAMHGASDMDMHGPIKGVVRRLIFLKISEVPIELPYDFFSIGAKREPIFMLDIEIHNLQILDFKDLPKDTGWGTVPTPTF